MFTENIKLSIQAPLPRFQLFLHTFPSQRVDDKRELKTLQFIGILSAFLGNLTKCRAVETIIHFFFAMNVETVRMDYYSLFSSCPRTLPHPNVFGQFSFASIPMEHASETRNHLGI